MTNFNSINVGTRVGVENKRGVVKFVGCLNEVDEGKDVWLGIDWDNPKDGKHNGSLKGKQYFQAKYVVFGLFAIKNLDIRRLVLL